MQPEAKSSPWWNTHVKAKSKASASAKSEQATDIVATEMAAMEVDTLLMEWGALRMRLREDLERSLSAQDLIVQEIWDRIPGMAFEAGAEAPGARNPEGGAVERFSAIQMRLRNLETQGGVGVMAVNSPTRHASKASNVTFKPQRVGADRNAVSQTSSSWEDESAISASQESAISASQEDSDVIPTTADSDTPSGANQGGQAQGRQARKPYQQSVDAHLRASPQREALTAQPLKQESEDPEDKVFDKDAEHVCHACGHECVKEAKICPICRVRRMQSKAAMRLGKGGKGGKHAHRGSVKVSSLKDLHLTLAMRYDRDAQGQDIEAKSAFHKVMKWLFKKLDWWVRLAEPDHSGLLNDFVMGNRFQTAMVLAVISNCMFVIVGQNHAMNHLGEPPDASFVMVERAYAAWFSCELLIRMALHRQWFFINTDWAWNFLDILVVMSAVWSVVFSGANFSFLRSIRILKITRILRLLRVMWALTELRVMVTAMFASLSAMFWCLMILAFTLTLFALLFVQVVEDYLLVNLDEPCAEEPCVGTLLKQNFGSVQLAILSLYMATTGGNDWSFYYEMLSEMSIAAGLAFIFYTAIYTFGIFNLLTGMFVDKALQAAKPDADLVAAEQRLAEQDYIEAFHELMDEFDANNDGLLNGEEYKALVISEKGKMFMDNMGLETKHTDWVFSGLRDRGVDGKVPLEEFVKGCTRIRSAPSNLDIHSLQYDIALVRKEVHRLTRAMKMDKKQARRIAQQGAEEAALLDPGRAARLISVFHGIELEKDEQDCRESI